MTSSTDNLIADIAAHLRALNVRHVLVYGYTTPKHTHHWIQVAFVRAFEYLRSRGVPINIRFEDNASCLSTADLDDTLVIGNVNTDRADWALPINPSAFYLIHNHNPSKLSAKRYDRLKSAGRCMSFEVFRGYRYDTSYAVVESEPCHLVSSENCNAVITWATDLLPHEIDDNMKLVENKPQSNARNVVFVGSIWRVNKDALAEVVKYCEDNDLVFEQYGDYVVEDFTEANNPNVTLHSGAVPYQENMELVRNAFIAPAIQGDSQVANDDAVGNYVPCRIFKNISYGSYAVSNNPTVNQLFGGQLTCHRDIGKLMHHAQQHAESPSGQDKLLHLMSTVRDGHTYLNRINTLLAGAVRCTQGSQINSLKSAPSLWQTALDNGARRGLAHALKLFSFRG